MSKTVKKVGATVSTVQLKMDPFECPFREFKDNELSADFWGLGTAAFRAVSLVPKASKPMAILGGQLLPWEDEQTQPLPKSVRQYLHGWERAEDLATSRWECELLVFDESNVNRMSVVEYQMTYAQVFMRSSFCRQVLSACFMLERVENLQVEHQTDNFSFSFGPEGWRARYHIYSPGMKAGGGVQHRPTLSKNGCYLVRLYYLGAWRCVWVSDQVPVDASGAPLLPFAPLSSPQPVTVKGKNMSAMVTSHFVFLWPLLLCKALLKIAAPEMAHDYEEDVADEMEEDLDAEDELMPDFDLMHSLTGGCSVMYPKQDFDELWKTLSDAVKVFTWDDEDDMASSTVRSRSTKKPNPRDKEKESKLSKGGITTIYMEDTRDMAPYNLPGIAPALDMNLIVTMVRDVPLKRPLPEPDVPLWKHVRWVEWARAHGLYEDYECPRTKFLKVNGLMKLSYAPHLLEVQSTESITRVFREEQRQEKKPRRDPMKSTASQQALAQLQLQKDELREWVQFNLIQPCIYKTNVVYFPSSYEFATATNRPPVHITKAPVKGLDVPAPKASPLYLQIDSPEENLLKISISMLHPRILMNAGYPVEEYIEKAYVLLECFEWFVDTDLPKPRAYIQGRGYDSVEAKFLPGRHFCRLWVHSRMQFHLALLSESTLVLGTRDMIQLAATQECPWVARFLTSLGAAFSNWIRVIRSVTNIFIFDRDFFSSYQPDLDWDPEVVGYDKHFVHWMFRQALQSQLYKRLQPHELQLVNPVLRRYFCDPEFGFPPKPTPPKSYRDIMESDPCDCLMPEVESVEEESREEQVHDTELKPPEGEEIPVKPIVSDTKMAELLKEPKPPIASQVCELAGEDLPCGLLKVEREKMIRKHEAATIIQSQWRGCFARKALSIHVNVTSDIQKLLMENAFGNMVVLSELMNEFFLLFPGAKYAYSVASGLAGIYSIQQHNGTSPVTPKCKWIPYFQGVFYCHYPVKVHFDVQSTIEHSTVQIYDNDTGEMLPQAYNAHITFDIHPNVYGYTVMGHGSFNNALGISSEIHWQLTVLSSIDNMFHMCDNDLEKCKINALIPATKLHIDEFYIPNRRNILGGIQISVTKVEAVSFRAAATTPDLEIEAILRTTTAEGEVEEVARCQGKGEIFWPYIRLKPPEHMSLEAMLKHISVSRNMLGSNRSLKGKSSKDKKSGNKSSTKLNDTLKVPPEMKTYTIEVIAPGGWQLPIDNWKRIEEVRQEIDIPKFDPVVKKAGKEKLTSARDKKKEQDATAKEAEKVAIFPVHEPLPDDAYLEIECATTVGGGAIAKRDDERDILFATALKSWDTREPGRNARGATLRQEFRDEFLVPPPQLTISINEELMMEEFTEEEGKGTESAAQYGPTPITESNLMEMEHEEEHLYFTTPEQLKDKFIPLYFVPLCTKEMVEEESAVLSEDMAEAARNERASRMEAALERMRILQEWNLKNVIGRQDHRSEVLETLFIDASWSPDLAMVMDQRNEAVAREMMERQQSALKKKADLKKADTKPAPGKKK